MAYIQIAPQTAKDVQFYHCEGPIFCEKGELVTLPFVNQQTKQDIVKVASLGDYKITTTMLFNIADILPELSYANHPVWSSISDKWSFFNENKFYQRCASSTVVQLKTELDVTLQHASLVVEFLHEKRLN